MFDRIYTMAQSTAQANKSQAITLKGSAELIGEFFGEFDFWIIFYFFPFMKIPFYYFVICNSLLPYVTCNYVGSHLCVKFKFLENSLLVWPSLYTINYAFVSFSLFSTHNSWYQFFTLPLERACLAKSVQPLLKLFF